MIPKTPFVQFVEVGNLLRVAPRGLWRSAQRNQMRNDLRPVAVNGKFMAHRTIAEVQLSAVQAVLPPAAGTELDVPNRCR